jgi:hypothetical protein
MAAGTPPAMLSDEALYQKTGSWEAAAAARDAQNNALNAYNNEQAAAARDQAAKAANITADAAKLATAVGSNTNVPTPAPVVPDASNWWASQPGGVDAMYDYLNNQINTTFKNATDAQIDAAMQQYGISSEDIAGALRKGGGSKAEEYAIGAGNMGLSGLNTNINSWIDKARQDQAFKAMTGAQQQDAARAAMGTVNMNEADVIRATGKTIAELFPTTLTKPTSVIPTGYYGNDTGNPLTRTPGDITTNPDGSVTVHPNIPGRPDGGFTGMGQVKDVYTAGGGSLGYTAKAPKTIAEFNQLYNKQTGDSLAAYDYLMGKGGGKYPVKSGVSEIQKPYNEFVLGKKSTRPMSTKTDKASTVVGTPGQPQTYFDEAAYLAANPDVAAELKTGKSVSGQPTQFKSGYEHYLMYGKAGGRPFAGDYQGYLTALALATSAGAGGGGEGPSGPGTSGPGGFSNNEANSITGLAQAPNNSIPDTVMGPDAAAAAAAAAATAADSAAASAASATGDAPGSDGSPGSGAKRGGLMPRGYAIGGGLSSLGSYSDGGRLLKGPGDGVSDSIPATIGRKQQPARLADGEFVIPARIVSELGNGSTDAGAKKLYAMMDRVQRARGKTTGKNKVAANSRADKYLPA